MERKRDRWKTICERVVRAVDPSFCSPIIFSRPRGPRESSGGRCGLDGAGLSGDLRPLLSQRREWKGPGFAAILALDKLPGTRYLLAAALHELCHFVVGMAETSNVRATLGAERFYSILAEPSKQTRQSGELTPPSSDPDERRESHNAAFFRIAAHVQSRADSRGYWLPHLADPTQYGFSAGSHKFAAALADETRALWDFPLSFVVAEPPPPEYTKFIASMSPATPS